MSWFIIRVLSVFLFMKLSAVASVHYKDPTLHPNWKLFEHHRCGLSQSDRIIGGKNATRGAYPWIARVGYVGSKNTNETLFRCGAVLVSKYYIVTAAHCVSNLPNQLKVGVIRLGEHNTLTEPDCEDDGVCVASVQDFVPDEIIVHKNYGKPQFKHDIAIIRLNKEVNFTSYVMPICMISGSLMTKNYVGEFSEVAGWGIYDIENPKPSVLLQTIKLPIVKNERCQTAFKLHAEIGPTQMCVGGQVGQDSCGGDSGGPLMKVESLDQNPPRYYLLGVVSFGAKRCGATTMPGVYTRISDYMEWVMDHMRQ